MLYYMLCVVCYRLGLKFDLLFLGLRFSGIVKVSASGLGPVQRISLGIPTMFRRSHSDNPGEACGSESEG